MGIVIDLESPVFEVSSQGLPMAEAVAQGFSHETLRSMLTCGGFHGCTDRFDEWGAVFNTGALALRWTSSARKQVFFYSVELADEAHLRIGFGVGFVNRVAVALDVSGKFSAYGFDKLIAAAPDSPVVKEATLWVVGNPHVSAG